MGGGPRAGGPTRDCSLPDLCSTPTWAWPSLTWKKAALARCTGMVWEPAVGMGARDEGKIWGQS